jgi:hypothetical protein
VAGRHAEPASALALIGVLAVKKINSRQRARLLGWFRVGAASSLAFVSRADGFDETCGFPTSLARKCIVEELTKRRFGFHAQKLLQEFALFGNFLQGPREQIVKVETRRTD